MHIYGKNVAKETLNSDTIVKRILLEKSFNDKEVLELINKKNIDIIYKEKRELDHLINGIHQGIVLEIKDFVYTDINDVYNKENAFVIILDHIEDPHNLGAIIRTSEAAGVDRIVITKDRCCDVNATVMKTSAGALSKIKVSMVTNLSSTMKALKKNGFWIIGTDMNGTDYKKIDYKGKIAIVIGSEGTGMSRIVKEECDFISEIPMKGKVNSLNASVAAGIIIFEAASRR